MGDMDSSGGGHGGGMGAMDPMQGGGSTNCTGRMGMGSGEHGAGGDDCNSTGSGSHGGHTFEITDGEIYFEAVILVISIVIGTIANTLALVVLATNKSMHTGSFLLFANLSITGLLIATLCMPFHLAGVIHREWTLGDVACEVEGHLIAVCALVAIVTHTMIAIVRYMAGAAPQHVYRKFSTWKSALIMSTIAWIMGGLLDGLGVATDVVKAGYTPLYTRCTPVNMKNVDGLLIASAVVIFIFYSIICFCYLRLFIIVKQKVAAIGTSNSKNNERFLALTKTLIWLSVLLIVCWLPFLVICGIDPNHDGRVRIILHRLGHDFAEILSCINPIFYFMRIDEFKKALRRLFGLQVKDDNDNNSSTANTVIKKKDAATNAPSKMITVSE